MKNDYFTRNSLFIGPKQILTFKENITWWIQTNCNRNILLHKQCNAYWTSSLSISSEIQDYCKLYIPI